MIKITNIQPGFLSLPIDGTSFPVIHLKTVKTKNYTDLEFRVGASKPFI